MSIIMQIPRPGIEYEKNNLFNCNLDTLDKFFPPEGFPKPKEINYISLGFYFLHYDEYNEQFNEDIFTLADKFNNPELYYKFMEEDLGLKKDPKYPKAPLKYMYEKYKVNVFETCDLEDFERSELLNYANDIITRLHIYSLLADKNLIFAKDQLKRMRRSVTCMDKRLRNQTSANSLYMVTDLTRYFRRTLDIYEDYINDKTKAAKFMYDDLVRSIKYFMDTANIPDNLFKLYLMPEKEKLV